MSTVAYVIIWLCKAPSDQVDLHWGDARLDAVEHPPGPETARNITKSAIRYRLNGSSKEPVCLNPLLASGVVVMHPITSPQVSLRLMLTLPAGTDLDHTGYADSPAEKHSSIAVVLRT
ncbi:hypothetical protein Trydic_g18920 [Trypoxylus dichotomus]